MSYEMINRKQKNIVVASCNPYAGGGSDMQLEHHYLEEAGGSMKSKKVANNGIMVMMRGSKKAIKFNKDPS